MSAMIDDAAGIEPALGFGRTEARIARRETVRSSSARRRSSSACIVVLFWVFWAHRRLAR